MFNILPKPTSEEKKDGKTVFSADTVIKAPAKIIVSELKFLDFENGASNKANFVLGECDADYKLIIDGNIKAVSNTEEGLFHAAMTLKQLIFDAYKDGIATLENCVISDSPRFGYRGFMLDVVRHFFDKEVVKKIIDVLALTKMNKLHLHLSDNQGYRLESTEFPILNEKGSLRKGTRGDGVPVGGYFTKADIKEIVVYAKERFIEVIPEIDLPGHTVAMLAAIPELSCTGEIYDVAERYGIDSRIICAGKESNYVFLEKLLKEVTEMFPTKYFHIGGDEVPKAQWENCAECKKIVEKESLKDFEQLQGYFTNRVVRMLKNLNKVPIVWNEALNSGMLDEGVVCQYWQDGKKPLRVTAAAAAGRKTIVSKYVPYYLDYPYMMSSLKKVYKFEISASFDEKCMGNVIGLECPLWTEWVADVDRLYYQAFPRALAVANSAWADGKKDYADFKKRLYNVLGLLQLNDVGFASVKEADPDVFSGTCKLAKFFINMIDIDAFSSMKNQRSAKKGRKSVQ